MGVPILVLFGLCSGKRDYVFSLESITHSAPKAPDSTTTRTPPAAAAARPCFASVAFTTMSAGTFYQKTPTTTTTIIPIVSCHCKYLRSNQTRRSAKSPRREHRLDRRGIRSTGLCRSTGQQDPSSLVDQMANENESR
jgi:hypothetical protein